MCNTDTYIQQKKTIIDDDEVAKKGGKEYATSCWR